MSDYPFEPRNVGTSFIREGYVHSGDLEPAAYSVMAIEFDRWLSVHDRQVAEEAVRDRLPDGAKWFPVEGGIMWQGKVYYPADYVMTREDIRQVAEKALRRYAEALTENPSSDSWPASAVPADIEDWIKHFLADHAEPADEKEQSDGEI